MRLLLAGLIAISVALVGATTAHAIQLIQGPSMSNGGCVYDAGGHRIETYDFDGDGLAEKVVLVAENPDHRVWYEWDPEEGCYLRSWDGKRFIYDLLTGMALFDDHAGVTHVAPLVPNP